MRGILARIAWVLLVFVCTLFALTQMGCAYIPKDWLPGTGEDGNPVPPAVEALPFAWSEVKWCEGPDASAYPETATATWTIGGGFVRWTLTGADHWPVWRDGGHDLNNAPGYVVKIGDRWCATSRFDWGVKGNSRQGIGNMFSRDDLEFDPPMKGWKARSGDELWMFACSVHHSGVKERTRPVKVVFP